MITHTRYSGQVRVDIYYVGRSNDNRAEYAGTVYVEIDRRQHRIPFSELRSGVGGVSSGKGWGYCDEDEQAFDAMADNVLDFYSFYTPDNRGEDTPDWAPEGHICQAIGDSAEQAELEGFSIRREPDGPIVFTDGRNLPEFVGTCPG